MTWGPGQGTPLHDHAGIWCVEGVVEGKSGLANASERPSMTLHVYGGEMTSCHTFEPLDNGRYLRREHALCYHE